MAKATTGRLRALRTRATAARTLRLHFTPEMERARRKFLRLFPDAFRDETYLAWERDYKVEAHREWQAGLNEQEFRALLRAREFAEAARRAVKIESGRHFLFSFEKMALRDAVKSESGAQAFVNGLYDFLYGPGSDEERFTRWCAAVAALPRKQTRVLTWPLVTVFGFIAEPKRHVFLKPNTTRRAARKLRFDFDYVSRPNWTTYAAYLQLADYVRRSLSDWRPRDMIDIQSFLWVQGSDEYT
jgi:hypothetical protein